MSIALAFELGVDEFPIKIEEVRFVGDFARDRTG